MKRKRDLQLQQYNISKRRYRELYNFCLQYPEWKKELQHNSDSLGAVITDGAGGLSNTNKVSDQTGNLAIRRVLLTNKCDIVEKAAQMSNSAIAEYIIKEVTDEYINFDYLYTVMDIPCGNSYYYKYRRNFFYHLDKLKD